MIPAIPHTGVSIQLRVVSAPEGLRGCSRTFGVPLRIQALRNSRITTKGSAFMIPVKDIQLATDTIWKKIVGPNMRKRI